MHFEKIKFALEVLTFSFQSTSVSTRETKHLDRAASPVQVYIPLILSWPFFIKRVFKFLEWIWLLFHWMKWKNVSFMGGKAMNEVYIFSLHEMQQKSYSLQKFAFSFYYIHNLLKRRSKSYILLCNFWLRVLSLGMKYKNLAVKYERF